MKRIFALFAAVFTIGFGAIAAPVFGDTTAAFNGCVYHANTYAEAAQQWIDAGFPTCGDGSVTSVSVTVTVSGNVEDLEDSDNPGSRSSWGRGQE